MPFTHTEVVTLDQTDAAGVLYFARVFDLAHHAYETMLREAGWGIERILSKGEMALPIIHAACDLTAPVRLGDTLTTRITRERLGETSYALRHTIRRGNLEVATVRTVHVCVATGSGHKRRLPEGLQRVIEDLEPASGNVATKRSPL